MMFTILASTAACRRRAAVPGPTQHRTTDEREKERDARRGGDLQIGRRRRRHVGLGAKEADDRRCRGEHHDRDGNGQQESPDNGLASQLVGTLLLTGADRLRDQHRRADIDRREDRDDEEDQLEADPDAGHGRGAEARHHERVDRANQRLEQVLPDDRRGQLQHPALRHRLDHHRLRTGIGRADSRLMPVGVADLARLSHDLQLGQWLG